MSNSHRNIKVPRSRGYSNFDLANIQSISALNHTEETAVDPQNVNDLIIHALISRVTTNDNATHEFLVKYIKETNTLDIDIPQDVLDKITDVKIGDKAAQYLAWLASSFVNLRRNLRTYTIGGSPITTGPKGIGLVFSSYSYLDKIEMYSNAVGDIEIEITKTSFDAYPVSESITGGDHLILNGQDKLKKIDFDAWNIHFRPDDLLQFEVVNAPSNIELVTISLFLIREDVVLA